MFLCALSKYIKIPPNPFFKGDDSLLIPTDFVRSRIRILQEAQETFLFLKNKYTISYQGLFKTGARRGSKT
jgi:hypothetical protein